MKLEALRMHFLWQLTISTLVFAWMLGGGAIHAADNSPCSEWVARLVSHQGKVEVRQAGTVLWKQVRLNDQLCAGDFLRVGTNSRAALVTPADAVLRLDQNTTLNFPPPENDRTYIMQVIEGVANFFSRIPRTLKVLTPFVNGTVEGTEFLVRVEADRTTVTLYEGHLDVGNDHGQLVMVQGESAQTIRGQAPQLVTLVKPRDAVNWALYYPPTLFVPSGKSAATHGAEWGAAISRSQAMWRKRDFNGAFGALSANVAGKETPAFLTYRASLYLAVGRVQKAAEDIQRLLQQDPNHSDALALNAIVAVTQNRKKEALDLADRAVRQGPDSVVALIAQSYARQAHFDITGARDSLKQAVSEAPDNGIAWARLAELALASGDYDAARIAAEKAVLVDNRLSRAHMVLGYIRLTEIRIDDARQQFEMAIAADSADPLARMGLGLTLIRRGDLEAGRREIEIAAGLDPNNAVVRSYLGKAYFEEKRDPLAARQYEAAKALDASDPTPYFYDAIRKQTINRPVEALSDLQRAIELNGNRAVYRSSLLLDQDLAARSASLARVYNDIGFQQRGLLEGYNSVNSAPADYSGHRFLADSYAALPRHDIARVSELLQSQLLQPLNVTPVQPRLAESNLFILEGSGPAAVSFNEFNPLFLRNRLALQISGVGGENDTLGDEIVQSGVWNNVSYSLGQFHYESDGFRDNNDQDTDIYNGYAQAALAPGTSIQAEIRHKSFDRGDLPLRFDENNFDPFLKQKDDITTYRFGIRHDPSPRQTLIGSFIFANADFDSKSPPLFTIETDEKGFLAEGQYIYQAERLRAVAGVGYYNVDRDDDSAFTIFFPPFPPFTIEESETSNIDHTNAYLYTTLECPAAVTWTLGASADIFNGGIKDRERFNPKLGVSWRPFDGTTLRSAVYSTVTRSLITSQTIEPTQVAGFNQFFDDPEGTEAWGFGISLDQKLSTTLFAGLSYTTRDLDVPYLTNLASVDEADWDEYTARAYLYWAPHDWVTLSGEYLYEKFDRQDDAPGEAQVAEVKTHRFPLAAGFFHPSGLFARLKGTYVDQDGEFVDFINGGTRDGDDQFWVVDAGIGYRFPKRYGIVSLEALNLFDEDFHFQDTDPAQPFIQPERRVLLRLTLAF